MDARRRNGHRDGGTGRSGTRAHTRPGRHARAGRARAAEYARCRPARRRARLWGGTVLLTYPGTGIEWDEPIPGAVGCTLENRLFTDAWPDFRRAGVEVRGVGTRLPHEQAEFARAEAVPFPLLSDAGQRLAAALRLPTFRGAGRLRLKRLILVVGPEGTARHVLFPVEDIPAAVTEALRLATASAGAGPDATEERSPR
ncbi:redoxin domain-containing protein [Streptomyces sp. NPDC101166]|uniref:redoxin domain-containing protein n=1 Tax=Streptomyces sp. NPDC101166 TaxID=3366120 RepID=UPI00380A5088